MNMSDKRPLILISNDDGYLAGGINQLTDMVKSFGDVIVVAPDSGRSGAGMSITSSVPVSVRKIQDAPGCKVYACSGSPVDCVKLAVHSLTPRRPDLIVSGINYGDNSGVNAHYSGTMGVVLEGCIKGIPSIGFSSCETDKHTDFSPYTEFIQHVVEKTLAEGLPQGTCLNVNFPKGESYKGVKVARQDKGQWFGEWEITTRQNGDRHYWLSGEYVTDVPEDDGTDRWALDHGFIAVTPTTIDLTQYQFMDTLSEWFKA